MAHAICAFAQNTRYSLWLLHKTAEQAKLGRVLNVELPEDANTAADDIDRFTSSPDTGNLSSDALSIEEWLQLLEYLCANLCLAKLASAATAAFADPAEIVLLSDNDVYLLTFHYQCAIGMVLKKIKESGRDSAQAKKFTFTFVPWCPFNNRASGTLLQNVPWQLGVLHALYCGYQTLAAFPLPLHQHALSILDGAFFADNAPYNEVMFGTILGREATLDVVRQCYLRAVDKAQMREGKATAINGYELLFGVTCLLPFMKSRSTVPPSTMKGVIGEQPFEANLPQAQELALKFGTNAESIEEEIYFQGSKKGLLMRLCYLWRQDLAAPALLGTSVCRDNDIIIDDDDYQKSLLSHASRLNAAQLQLALFAYASFEELMSAETVPAEAVSTYLRLISSLVMPSAQRLSAFAALLVDRLQRVWVTHGDDDNKKKTRGDWFVHRLALAALASDLYGNSGGAETLHYTELLHVLVKTIPVAQDLGDSKEVPPKMRLSFKNDTAGSRAVMQRLQECHDQKQSHRFPAFCPPLFRVVNQQEMKSEHWLNTIFHRWGEQPGLVGTLDGAMQYSLFNHGLNTNTFGGNDMHQYKFYLSGPTTAAPPALQSAPQALKDCYVASAISMSLLLCELSATRLCLFFDAYLGVKQEAGDHLSIPNIADTLWHDWLFQIDNCTAACHYPQERPSFVFEGGAQHTASLFVPKDRNSHWDHRKSSRERWHAARSLVACEIVRLLRKPFANVATQANWNYWIAEKKEVKALVPLVYWDEKEKKKLQDSLNDDDLSIFAKLPRAKEDRVSGHLHTFAAEATSHLQGKFNDLSLLAGVAFGLFVLCEDVPTLCIEVRDLPGNIWPLANGVAYPRKVSTREQLEMKAGVNFAHLGDALELKDAQTVIPGVALLPLVDQERQQPGDTQLGLWDQRAFFAAFGCHGRRLESRDRNLFKEPIRQALRGIDVEECYYKETEKLPSSGWFHHSLQVYRRQMPADVAYELFLARSHDMWCMAAMPKDDSKDIRDIAAFELLLANEDKQAPRMRLERLLGNSIQCTQMLRNLATQITRRRVDISPDTADLNAVVFKHPDGDDEPLFRAPAWNNVLPNFGFGFAWLRAGYDTLSRTIRLAVPRADGTTATHKLVLVSTVLA